MNPKTPRLRVLVVDDVPDILMLFREASRRLRGVDVDVITECNAARAIDRLRAERFDVVVSDCRMREADGVEVLTVAHESNPTGIRVMMTGYNTIPATLDRVDAMRVDAYLHKPVPVSEVLRLLRAYLARDENVLHESRQHARAIERIALLSQGNVQVQ